MGPSAVFSILEVRKLLAYRKWNRYSKDNQPAACSVHGQNYLGSDVKLVSQVQWCSKKLLLQIIPRELFLSKK